MTRKATFTNWAGNQSSLPSSIQHPSSATAVAELVANAAQHHGRVKAVGAGHSFTDTACTDGHLLRLDQMAQVEEPDMATNQVTVGAGIVLARLNEQLDAVGLALPNLGDIDVQTLAGATSTGTHGTGLALGNLSTAIAGFEMVTGTGEVLWCDADHNPEVFAVGRVGLGALGIITRIRLQCVPAFVLRATEKVQPVDDVMADWSGFITSADHAELFLLPTTGTCLTKQNTVTDEAPEPPSPVQHFVDKELIENGALDVAMRLVRRFPSQHRRLSKLFASLMSDRSVVDKSYRIFASPRRVRFTEMEYSIPLDAVPEALERVRASIAAMAEPPLFPIEVRCSAGDDIALSTAEGGDRGWIAVHRYRGIAYGDYFRAVEAIMNDYGGRPHWGKLHFQTHDTLAERYPRWNEFQRVRAALDPHGVFANPYLDRVLGPIQSAP